ncbi:MAG: hypothetical protein Q9188_001664 [Gyalolechia gomerana]
MSTYLPPVVPFGSASTEDPMELYPDLENHPTAEDGIDIDLDLTTDPPGYLDDDEMIEDAEVDVEEDAIDPKEETGHDEQMIDEAVEDVGVQHDVIEEITSEHDEDLDDVGFAEPSDQLGDNGRTPGQLLQSDRSSLGTNSQEIAQQSIQGHSSLGPQTFSDQRVDFPGSPQDGQDLNGPTEIYEGNGIEELIRKRHSPSTEVSTSRTPQGAAEEPQVIQAEHDRNEDQLNAYTSDSSSPLNSSKKLSENAENGAANTPSRIARQELHSPQNYAGQRCYAAQPPHSYDNFSTVSVLHRGDANKRRTDVPDESHEHSHASVIPETSLDQDTSTSPEDSYVHPVVVLYEESEMFLFPPAAEEQDDDQTYFLTNEALAAEPIQTVLRECRNVLEGNISDQQELEVNVDALGLRICESSVDAADISLAHVLDIYLQLHYHDGNNSPPPMALSLTTNLRFSHRLSYLSSFVANGKGISQLEEEDATVRPDSPESAEELRTVEAIWQEPTAYEGNAEEFPAEEIHGHHNSFTQRSVAGRSTENSRHEPASVNNSVDPITTNDGALIENGDVANGATMTDSKLSASGKEIPTANHGSTIPLDAENFQEKADKDEEAEDGIGYEENDDPSEDSSTESSTVQGDDFPAMKEDAGALTERKADDDGTVSAPELVVPEPGVESGTEDIITYDSDDEDDHGDPGDTSLQDTGNVDPQSKEAVHPQSVASLGTKDALSRIAVGNNEGDANTLAARTSDVDALPHKKSNSDYERTDQDEEGEPETEAVQDEAWRAEEYEEIDRDGMLNSPTLQEVHGDIDHSNSALNCVTNKVDVGNPKNTAQLSTQSAVDEDEDEITFEDEIEDAVAKDPVDASTVYTSEQAVYASPGFLKRGRAYDDSADRSDTPGKTIHYVDYRKFALLTLSFQCLDMKRVRSR